MEFVLLSYFKGFLLFFLFLSLKEALNPNTSATRLQEILDLDNLEICQAVAINPKDISFRLGADRKYIVEEGDLKVKVWKESGMVYAMVV